MKTRLLMLLFFIIGISTAQAQLNFVDGYVVTNRNDTLYGKIKYSTPALRSSKVVFLENGTDKRRPYKPFQIKSYYVESTTYDSKIYDIDPALPFGYGVFMERRNEGVLKVYYYWNTNKERGFTQTFLENDGDYLMEVDFIGFRKQMVLYFEDYPKLQSKLKKGTYKKRDLDKIVAEYNEWKRGDW